MKIFHRLIADKGGSLPQPNEGVELSDRIITPATMMTLARVVLGAALFWSMVQEEKPKKKWLSTGLATLAGLSDMEGKIARSIDKVAPESGLGASVFGKKVDPYADSLFCLGALAGTVFSKNVPIIGKMAASAVGAQEGSKAIWAVNAAFQYRKATEQNLEITGTVQGKDGMAQKMTALELAIMSSEIADPAIKNLAAIGALFFAVSGSYEGELARRGYDITTQEEIARHLAQKELGMVEVA
ncbi:hypothetical protein KBC31_03500 [Candidatus Saccharibacteria bacterium]|jgi:phosphatidylglycerophosphate synthase|nr:hypothetical protein [Candidatus Saccharibacteria bacterium]